MDTPICDFVRCYAEGKNLRLHMPGHKGISFLGMESLDITEIDGYFSLNDKMSDVMASEEGRQLFMGLMANAMKNHGDKSMMGDMGAEMLSGPMMQMMGGFTMIRLAGLMGMAGVNFTREELLDLNKKLNKIKRKKKK